MTAPDSTQHGYRINFPPIIIGLRISADGERQDRRIVNSRIGPS
jgi:hypothetical protein